MTTPGSPTAYLSRTAWECLDEAKAVANLTMRMPGRLPRPAHAPGWRVPPEELDRKSRGREFTWFNRGMVGAW